MMDCDEMPASSADVHSLETLFERYSSPVFNYLLRLSGDRPLADDLTGETFYRAMLGIDGFREDASVKTWLLRIARNLYLRRASRERRSISLEALQESGISFVERQAGPEEQVLNQEGMQSIQRALLALSEGDRSILLLSAQEKMIYREIGRVLDISEAAVKVRIHRARRRFAAVLKQANGLSRTETQAYDNNKKGRRRGR
jgi:RNA polymerase sigma-70 factor (ECF subfamily)